MKVDYLIVGGGYAGSFFALNCLQAGKTFMLADEPQCSASRASAGVVNPVVLKKFVPFDGALNQIQHFRGFIRAVEDLFQQEFYREASVHRVFHDDAEKHLWLKKAAREDLIKFLEPKFHEYPLVNAPFGTGRVKESGYFLVDKFFKHFSEFLQEKGLLVPGRFDYSILKTNSKTYQDIQWKQLIFAEGAGIDHNPFFGNLPIQPNKGQGLVIDCDVNITTPVKKKHFLVPVGPGRYYYGGTYDRFDRSTEINSEKTQELLSGLDQILPHPYTVKEIRKAFRPTVPDRKPLVGRHKQYPNLWILNGMGARGLLNGSYYASQLFAHIQHQTPLDAEVDVYRFESQLPDKR